MRIIKEMRQRDLPAGIQCTSYEGNGFAPVWVGSNPTLLARGALDLELAARFRCRSHGLGGFFWIEQRDRDAAAAETPVGMPVFTTSGRYCALDPAFATMARFHSLWAVMCTDLRISYLELQEARNGLNKGTAFAYAHCFRGGRFYHLLKTPAGDFVNMTEVRSGHETTCAPRAAP